MDVRFCQGGGNGIFVPLVVLTLIIVDLSGPGKNCSLIRRDWD